MSLVVSDISSGLLARLAAKLPKVIFDQWFARAEVVSWDGRRLELGVQNRFFKSRIETTYMGVLCEAATAVVGAEVSVGVSVSPKLFAAFREEQERASAEAAALEVEQPQGFVAPEASSAPSGRLAGMPLNPEYTFSSFVVGPSNRLSHAVALRAVENPGGYGRICFCGEHGVGKTHLLQAICRETERVRPGAKVIYVTCEKFVADFVAAHANGGIREFRSRYRGCDVLAFDEIQVLGQGNKSASQAELLSIMDNLEARGRQAVFASTCVPGELPGVEPKLRDRLGSGFVDRISLPDEATRRELLAGMLQERGVEVPASAVALMARELSGNVRRIEGAVSRLAALIEVGGMEPTATCVRMAMEVSSPPIGRRSALEFADVISAVAEEYGVSPEAVVGRGRAVLLRRARQVAVVLCRKLLGGRYVELGKAFGGRSHATVLSMVKSAPRELFSAGLEGRPVERILFRLGVQVKPEEILESQRALFE